MVLQNPTFTGLHATYIVGIFRQPNDGSSTTTTTNMRNKLRLAIKFFAFTAVSALNCFHADAQEKAVVVTQEMINKVNDIVRPLREQADKLLQADATGIFKAYQSDVAALNKMKNGAGKSKASAQIMERYASFFKNIWAKIKVDEKAYQAQIRSVFPAAIAERITFQQYLNFSCTSSTNTNSAPPPAPAPDPENKCIDVCSIARGQITGDAGLIGGGAGSYGNCFLKVNSWGVVAGGNDLYGGLKNNITIPGTLPADGRKLRVKISFDLKQEAVAFAILGFSLSETTVNTYQGHEYLLAVAPVIFATSKISQKTYSEEYVIEKTEVGKSIINAFAHSFAYFVTANWCYSDCTNIKWTICEEK